MEAATQLKQRWSSTDVPLRFQGFEKDLREVRVGGLCGSQALIDVLLILWGWTKKQKNTELGIFWKPKGFKHNAKVQWC